MRVVVTGASGNVGTSVVDALAARDDVTSILGISRRLPTEPRPQNVAWAVADIIDSDLLQSLFEGADAVIHLAWAIQPSRDDALLRATNVLGSRRVFDAAAAAGVGALIHASSVGAYSPGPADGSPVDESWETGGIETSFYSRHKAEVETILDGVERDNHEMRVVRLRPGLIFKSEAASEIRRLFGGPLIPSPLLRPDLLPAFPWIRGLATQVVHAEDVGAAYALAATGPARGAFNIAAGPVIDAGSLSRTLGVRIIGLPAGATRRLAALSWRARLQPTPEGWVDMAVQSPLMSTRRAHDVLGWTPRHTGTDTFRELLAGLASSDGRETPPLATDAGGLARWREFATGIGARD